MFAALRGGRGLARVVFCGTKHLPRSVQRRSLTGISRQLTADASGAPLRTADASGISVLVVDALNCLDRFVPCNEFLDCAPSLLFAEARARIAHFTAALETDGIEAIFVFDNGQATPESNSKWLRRRRREVESGTRNMPVNAEVLMMAMLEEAGFPVLFPPGIDGDDAVALLALKFDGFVLSRDQDMMRYGLPPGRVLQDFRIRQSNKLEFHARLNLPDRSPRDPTTIAGLSGDPLSDWRPTSSLLQCSLSGIVRRGNADANTRTLGNLYDIARPLRAALYARLGVTTVTELLPAWRSGAFTLESSVVDADPLLDHLLDNSSMMYDWIRTNDNAGATRLHATAMIAAEIQDAATPVDARTSCRRIADFYETLHPADPTPPEPHKGWCAGGPCAGMKWAGSAKACLGDGHCYPMEIEKSVQNAKNKRKSVPLCNPCLTELTNLIKKKSQKAQKKKLHLANLYPTLANVK